MDEYLRNYFIALAVLVPVDFLWFGVLMKGLYLGELQSIARMKDGRFAPNLIAGVLAWAVIPLGIILFAVPHLTPDGSVLDALKWGGLLGLCSYGMYDLTNLSTLRGFSLKLALIDVAWGTALTAAVTTVVWLVAK
jgi:uncharacterized membrane protein